MTAAILRRQLPVVGEQRGRLQEERRPAPAVLALLLVGLFLLRVYYGLSLELHTEDDVQIYLLGLKFFTSGQWPFFGPDVIPGQVPGPMQGLLVGLPLFLTGEPEAPLILLNILSFAGLVFLGHYLTRRFALVPAWITYAWLLTCPWTLNFSTHVYNPSYLLFLGCFFFVGFFELMPPLTANLVPPGASFFLLGFSLAASFQIHLSWPLLLPFVLIAILARARKHRLTLSQIGWLLVGTAVPVALLVPTVTRYGFASLFETLGSTYEVNTHNATAIVTITARFLSFASFEVGRFLRQSRDTQTELLRQSPSLIPFVVVLGILGLVQPFLMLLVLFRPTLLKRAGDPCCSVRGLAVATVLLVWVVFFFTSRSPIARNYYILCPVALLTGYLALGSLVQTPRGRRWTVAILAAGAIFHIGLASQYLKLDPWADRRIAAERAIEQRDYCILAERRPHMRY
jgi:hypothetical protein